MTGRREALARGGVVVRALSQGDEVAWALLRTRNREWLRPWEATEPPGSLKRPLSFRGLVREDALLWRRQRGINMVISTDGELVGRVCLTGIEWGSEQSGSLGYWVDQGHAGNGIAPMAAALLCEYGFRLGLHRIEIATRPENAASVRVAQKLGFRDEGTRRRFLYVDGAWRDHRIFALAADESRARGPWAAS